VVLVDIRVRMFVWLSPPSLPLSLLIVHRDFHFLIVVHCDFLLRHPYLPPQSPPSLPSSLSRLSPHLQYTWPPTYTLFQHTFTPLQYINPPHNLTTSQPPASYLIPHSYLTSPTGLGLSPTLT
jgi:hypothetical protein